MLRALQTNKLAGLLISLLPNTIKMPVLRMIGMKIDRDVRVGFGTVILCADVTLMSGARIGNFCVIRARKMHMGKRSEIQNLVKVGVHTLVIKSQSVICSSNEISGDLEDERSQIYMGPATWILPHCFINVARRIHLAKNVGVGGGSYLFTHGLWLSRLDGFPIAYGDITVEDDVWLPWGCFLLPGVTIGSRAIIGARSVVNRSIPSGVLAAGIPAKVIRDRSWVDLTEDDRADLLCELTHEHGKRLKMKVEVLRSPQSDLHYLDGALILALHKEKEVASFFPAPTLNATYGELPGSTDANVSIWSLRDYATTSYSALSTEAKSWLGNARSMGVRYYPVDEDRD